MADYARRYQVQLHAGGPATVRSAQLVGNFLCWFPRPASHALHAAQLPQLRNRERAEVVPRKRYDGRQLLRAEPSDGLQYTHHHAPEPELGPGPDENQRQQLSLQWFASEGRPPGRVRCDIYHCLYLLQGYGPAGRSEQRRQRAEGSLDELGSR